MAKEPNYRALRILAPWLEYQVEYRGERKPVSCWLHSHFNKVKYWQAVMRLTAGWPINWALERKTIQPIVWRQDPNRTSDFRGVSWIRDKEYWRVAMAPPGEHTPKQICHCDDEQLAAAVYNVAARRMYGKAARLNLT